MKDWLPITWRNRVALGLAFAGLVMFVVWNCLPHYDHMDAVPVGIVAYSLWVEEIFSPDPYVQAFKDPDIDGFLVVAACMALVLNALVALTLMPFWKMLHASAYIRMPLAIVNSLGGAVIVWFLYENGSEEPHPYWFATLLLMAAGMFAISAALFIFKNELVLREERSRPREG